MDNSLNENKATQAASYPHSLSATLKQARQAKGLELKDITASTNVRKDYLEALEEGNFEKLPEDIFARNFVRLYAGSVGIDPKTALDLYTEERGLSHPIPAPSYPDTKTTYIDTSTARNFASFLPIILLVAVLGAASYWLANRFLFTSTPTTTNSAQTENTPSTTLDTTTANSSLNESSDSVTADVTTPSPSLDSTNTSDITATNSEALESSTDSLTAPSSGNSPDNSDLNASSETSEPSTVNSGNEATSTNSTENTGTTTASEETIETPLAENQVLVSIITNPPGAEVRLGDALLGTSPILDTVISATEDTLELNLDGYEAFSQTVTLFDDSTLSFALLPETAAETSSAVESSVITSSDAGQIALSIEQPTWVELYQSNARGEGERLIYTTLQPGESFAYPLPVYLHVGNAGGVRLSVNEQDIGLFGAAGEVRGQAFQTDFSNVGSDTPEATQESPTATLEAPTEEPAETQ